jgi:hypothetical protein
MKKLFCVMVIVLAFTPIAFSQSKPIVVRAIVPIDFAGTMTASKDGSGDLDVNMGFGAGAEVMVGISQGLQVGGGAQFLLSRAFSKYTDEKFAFIPFYGLVSYSFDLGIVSPYAIGRIGYDLFTGNDAFKGSGDLTGGLYFAIGGGAAIKIPNSTLGAFVEADYSMNNGTYSYSIIDIGFAYKRLELCAGVSFSL